MTLLYKVKNEKNIYEICKNHFKISSRLYLKIKKNYISVNGNKVSTNIDLKPNDIIKIDLSYNEEQDNIVPNSNIKLDILFEDEWMLVVNKGPNLPVHPSLHYFETSLSNGVKYYYDSIGLNKKVRPVNRLDKDTSGIVIFAKCEYIQEMLSKQMQHGLFKKTYIALVEGILNNSGIIDKPIKRKDESIIERVVSADGEKAITTYKSIKTFNSYSLIELNLLTGRTHQIRVHMNSIDHPILGDTLYGKSSTLINRQALHSYKVEFIHPVTNKEIAITSPIPNDIKNLI